MPRTVKVAIVGTGLAGLTAAHLLTKPSSDEEVKFELHLFEKAPEIGMDSSSISLGNASLKQDWRIDVPMRSFQGGYYTNLISLYQSLGVRFRQADFSYSFSTLSFPKWRDRSITTTMIYNGGSGRSGVSKPAAMNGFTAEKPGSIAYFVQKLRVSSLFTCLTAQLLLCYFITLLHALPIWRPANLTSLTFRQWASQTTPTSLFSRLIGMDTAWKNYVQMVLFPLLSAVCTAPQEDVMDHPMEEILDYVWLTFGTHHYVVIDGVRDVVKRLIEGVDHLHLSSPIVSIQPDVQDAKCITISCLSNGQAHEYPGFHHIVLATQASGAVPILTKYLESLPIGLGHRKKAIERQIQCLKAFEYRPSVVINHTDGSLLPDNRQDIRDLNLITLAHSEARPESEALPGLCVSSSYTMATHILPTPKGCPPNQPTVFQTTNPIIFPNKDSLLSVANLERAIVTLNSKSALKSLCMQDTKSWWQCPYQAKTRLGELQGARLTSEKNGPGIWICGSYAHLGIPLLEGCVVSARSVVEQGILIEEGVKWTQEPW
ncbi:hypothetical protein GALMADRAFT_340113 [Galerina marginata CBS 339.88]|uniref:Amine oxidase domain-containing protein n=1 Tax=Galerina marginata (strain CBS 339.88) TaxID=685588 RepID=A0A067TSE4_GALM3|nr:hypothetical protein GALMADRAFT_340113 [Galerina marginata CBS 339.88]